MLNHSFYYFIIICIIIIIIIGASGCFVISLLDESVNTSDSQEINYEYCALL